MAVPIISTLEHSQSELEIVERKGLGHLGYEPEFLVFCGPAHA